MISIASTQGFMGYPDGHMMGMHWGWWIFWVVFLLLLVWLGARALGGGRPSAGGAPPRSAEELLRERFARGELSEDEFRQRLAVLRESEGH